jgi:hypothetical protein
MGLSLGGLLHGFEKAIIRPVLQNFPEAGAAALGLPPQVGTIFRAGFSGGNNNVAANVPALMTDTGDVIPTGTTTRAIMGMSQIVAQAVYKLASGLGIPLQATVASVSRVGSRIWASLGSFAARNPQLNLLTLLVGLGLTAEEAAHFLAWGSGRRRRRRGRGISSRDLRTTRRTIRKVVRISHDLRALHMYAPRARTGGARTTLVRQG